MFLQIEVVYKQAINEELKHRLMLMHNQQYILLDNNMISFVWLFIATLCGMIYRLLNECRKSVGWEEQEKKEEKTTNHER
ncbi:MAG: hypothetical protein ACI90V_006180 [Bacillariaceae sp.]|jgi:hypothetical protein